MKLHLSPGTIVGYLGNNYIIKRVLDLNTLLLENIQTENIIQAELKDIQPEFMDNNPLQNPLNQRMEDDSMLFSEEDWNIALKRLSIIDPILTKKLTVVEIKEIAKKEKVHLSTLYRWIERYTNTGQTSSLVPDKRIGIQKAKRIDKNVEEIIMASIEEVYLTKQKKSVRKVCEEINRRCINTGLLAPSDITIRRRIDAISDEHKMKGRYGKELTRTKYQPIQGHFPGADYPLSIVQIDHTKLDIILVDEIYRRPIDRPWITLAIDVYSRMVLGFYVSFDPPGALGTGMCLSNAILPKEMFLLKNEVKGQWPCWGIMDTIHADNGKEFRGNMLKRAAEQYGINLQWRPVKRPNWGGHIERLIGTVLTEIQSLPGTTFSNPMERRTYNSEKGATLTLKELEKWLTTFIVEVYHNKFHNGIGMSPFAKFNEGIFGGTVTKGRGIPPRIFNERKVRLDFMPFLERTIQEYGVQIDHIQYYDDKLRPFINSLEGGNKKQRLRRKFIFKRDPRDISVIYFYHPDLKEYFDIPYRDISHPPITIWEYNAVEKWLLNQGKTNIDENAIFEGYNRMKQIEESATIKKKITQRTKSQTKRRLSLESSFKSTVKKDKKSDISEDDFLHQDFLPFEDIEL